ncbi:dipicolinate synthase subunit B [Metallumcola ferriviriculae]|uniref:Dipicolinate synthase subunit B n=1 Tax=Metallumcola ferriviriculae TaxID=3039180 RepID=A0AAU0UNY6_9FIRM|nr:dipicolinate synthase subunit B [Desulfitibacteraceae bacterium MK1]
MTLKGKNVGFAFTGSHCTMDKVMPYLKGIVIEGAEVFPIFSTAVCQTDTRFGDAKKWLAQVESITGRTPISTIVEAEPIGPQGFLDVMVIAPCTGNTLAKLTNGITDGAVLMAAKAHLRNKKPLVLAISTNDGLGFNAKNIGIAINTAHIYLVPFGQDNPEEKSNSLVAMMQHLPETIEQALSGKQIQPMLIQYK